MEEEVVIDIEQRITAAIERITSGNAPMRVPADETDPDLVLADCLAEIRRLRAALAARQPVDSCTESECKRCRAHPDHRGSMEHAGISDFRQPVGSTPEWFELVIRDVCELDPEDPDAAGTVCIRLLDLRLIMERHALPAHAVDLGQFRDLAEFALRNAKLHNCWEKREALARELLDLIGSRDPRHG
ncbi:hypothetical protein D7V00_04475 [Stenotrophomonas maltophilia]|nr:hypothetical protein [Stenotrophomonas maltophilia]